MFGGSCGPPPVLGSSVENGVLVGMGVLIKVDVGVGGRGVFVGRLVGVDVGDAIGVDVGVEGCDVFVGSGVNVPELV